jgi:acyl-CoA thioesterase I
VKRVVLLIAFLCVACGDKGADNPLAVERQGAMQWREGQTIVALGTSLTFGFGAGCKVFPFDRDCALSDSSYPATLASRLKLPVVNLGVPGATTRDGFLRMTEALTHDPALALVELGANDLFQGVLVADARANLVMIIDRFRRAGVAVALLSFSHPDMIDHTPPGHRLQDQKAEALAYHHMLLALADEFGLPIVEYIFEDIWWKEELMFDSVHPNGRGYLLMEGNVVRGLHGFLVANDLYSE